MASIIAGAKRIVVKVGSSLVTNDGKGLDRAAIALWAGQIATLRKQGKEVVLVSSGAIAEGKQRLEAGGFEITGSASPDEFAAAIASFNSALEIRPDDPLAKIYIERCAAMQENPPAPDWDGVFVAKTK